MTAIVWITIVLTIFSGDNYLKNYIEESGTEGETKPICHNRLLLRKHHNKGAILNFAETKRPIVAGLSLLMTGAALGAFLMTLTTHGTTCLKLGLSLLLGGAFSNTYDRLKRKYVVDYISFASRYKGFEKIIFNISDFCIIIGSLLTALSLLKE